MFVLYFLKLSDSSGFLGGRLKSCSCRLRNVFLQIIVVFVGIQNLPLCHLSRGELIQVKQIS